MAMKTINDYNGDIERIYRNLQDFKGRLSDEDKKVFDSYNWDMFFSNYYSVPRPNFPKEITEKKHRGWDERREAIIPHLVTYTDIEWFLATEWEVEPYVAGKLIRDFEKILKVMIDRDCASKVED